jgi:hypothetical protein
MCRVTSVGILMLFSLPALAVEKTVQLDMEQGWHQKHNQTSRIAITLDLTAAMTESASFTTIIKGQLLGPDKLEPGRPKQNAVSPASQRVYLNNTSELELRELYFDIDFKNASLRLGKQQIVWGQADGLKLLDVVNPQDFRRFILDDFDDSRIPLWMLNLEMFLSSGDLQLLWIPDTSMHNLPEAGAIFEITAPLADLLSNTPVTVGAIDRPDSVIKDSDIGLRWSMFIDGWDVTLNYLYHYDDFPVTNVQIGNSGLLLSPRFERTHTTGASAGNAFGDFIVRIEMVYNTDKYLVTKANRNSATSISQIASTQELAYIIGLDWTGITDTFISVQLFQSHLLGGQEFARDEIDTNITLLTRRSFLNESLNLEMLWIYHLNNDDYLARLSADYELTTNLSMTLYADFFEGQENALFGQFDDKDQLGIKFSYGF